MASAKGKVSLPAYTKSDVYVFLAIVPLHVVISNTVLFGNFYFSSVKVFLTATFIYLFLMFLVFQVCGTLALKFLKWYPNLKDTPKRLVLSVLSYMAVTVAAITPLLWIFSRIDYLQYEMVSFTNIYVAFSCMLTNIIVTIVFEALAAFERWKASMIEAEKLKKENLSSQLESLKNQINPHFLFNSINSLSSLISEDPEKAEIFLDEMSKVYRYLLRNNEDDVIPLSMELQFIRSYFHLLKTRYGDAIFLDINVPIVCRSALIPPHTLQILVENAVKHNIIMKEQPLRIEIICLNNEYLTVRNNLQHKTVKVLTNGMGLENIAAKYQLLNQPPIVIKEENNYFTVTVPLVENRMLKNVSEVKTGS